MGKSVAILLIVGLWLTFPRPGSGAAPEDELAALQKKAEAGDAAAQFNLGLKYAEGEAVEKDAAEAVRWYRKAADQNHAASQCQLGWMLATGEGVEQNAAEAVQWYRKAAEQNYAEGQLNLGWMYANGQGVEKDYVKACLYYDLAAKTNPKAALNRDQLKRRMSRQQIAEEQQLLREWNPPPPPPEASKPASREDAPPARSPGSGAGFAITGDGYIVTAEQLVRGVAQVRVRTTAGLADATVVSLDPVHGIALLKVQDRFAPLPIAASHAVRIDSTVATVGFPAIGLPVVAPKVAKGEITAISGDQDDARYFQTSIPVQPGNSGGALVDARGNVIGVIVPKPGPQTATTGASVEAASYAVKSTFLMGFLESLPAVSAKLKEPNTRERKLEEVLEDVKRATVLVLVQ